MCTTIANRKRRVDLIRLKWGKQNKTSQSSRLAGNDREACGGRKAGVQRVQGLLEKSTVGSGRKSWKGALKRRSPGGRSTPKALERRANPDAKTTGTGFSGRQVMTNLDRILKSRDIPLPTKVSLAKAMIFPVVMYGYESWTLKKVEPRRIDAFELWCWRRLLRIPWTARGSNQSILK